jgi:chromosome segregation ATPase
MSNDTLRLVLQFCGVVIGAGGGQLVIFIFRRRGELKSLDATSGSTALDSANAYISTLQTGELSTRGELDKMHVRLESMQQQLDNERRTSTDALEASEREISRLRAELGRVRSDLAVAQSQIDQMGFHMPGRHSDPVA